MFFQKDSGLRPPDAPWNMAAAMLLFAALCIGIGVFPEALYRLLPYPVDYTPYTPGKVVFYLQLLLFSGLAFFLLLPLMRRTLTISLDTDWLWRVVLWDAGNRVHSLLRVLGDTIQARLRRALARARQRSRRVLGVPAGRDEGPSVFARSRTVGTTALWVALLLSAYVLVYLV